VIICRYLFVGADTVSTSSYAIVTAVIGVVGMLLTMAGYLGWLASEDRQSFRASLMKNLEISPDAEGGPDFLESFFYPQLEDEGFDRSTVDPPNVIRFVGHFNKSVSTNGKQVKWAFPGRIVAANEEGAKRHLCTTEELRQWAEESPWSFWLGQSLVLLSIVVSVWVALRGEKRPSP